MSEQALSDVRVLELGSFISAPYCGKLMSGLGAEVIKVEPPLVGDESRQFGPFLNDIPHPERSGTFLYFNTDKYGVTLDWKCAEGKKLLLQMLGNVDILVESNSPGEMRSLGLDYESLARDYPSLIVCSITPFGQTGPYSDYKGYGLNSAALGGGCPLGWSLDREPLTYPMFQGHIQGGVHGAAGTMVALFGRDLTGRGQHVDIAEADVWACYHTGGSVQPYISGEFVRKRTGFRMVNQYPVCVLPCKDGYIAEAALLDAHWESFLQLMGGGTKPEWASDPRFKDRTKLSLQVVDEIDGLQAPFLLSHTKEELFTMCRQAHVPFAPVYNMAEIVNHPHLKERNFFVDVDHKETGKLRYPGAPFRLAATPWAIRRPAPLLGQHNEEIYCARMGHTKEELSEWRKAGVI